MSIFSRSKRAKNATDEQKTSTTTEPAQLSSPTSIKKTPIDPTQPAYNAIAIVLTAEETRESLAAKWRRQSDMNRRSAARSYVHSRTNSEYSLPGAGWQTHRIRQPTSTEAIIQEMPIHDAELYPLPLVLRGREPSRTEGYHSPLRTHSEDCHAYSNPREVPLPPVKRNPPSHSRSRRLVKRKTPSSPVSVQQEPDKYLSSSSRDSVRNSASSTASTASSGMSGPMSLCSQLSGTTTSASSTNTERDDTKRTSINVPNFSKPTFAGDRKRPDLEISLPYSSSLDNSAEEIKTAKSLIPTWRYEDLSTDNELPIQVKTISPTHSRQSSFGSSIFRRKNLSVVGF